MKKLYILISICIIFISCTDVLNLQPIDKITEGEVWQDPVMIRGTLTDLYSRYPFFMFDSYDFHTWTDETTQSNGNLQSIPQGQMSRTNEPNSYWNYNYIRDLNSFIDKIADSPIAESLKNQMEGEARVMRAVAYFEKQKRYGGVPLVDVVIDPFVEEIDQQYTRRSSEEVIADFIDSELDIAIGFLEDNPQPKGRINMWAAYAYKARANLYAGSIAKYGTVQLDGVVGIPEARANDFFGKASEAAKTVIESGRYSLYDQIPDRSENYRNIWVDESNDEVIFERVYDGVNIGHNWDVNNIPQTLSSRNGGHSNPLLEHLLRYENVDGSNDQPEFGPGNLYDNGWGPFSNKDPRLRGSVIFQGDALHGSQIQTYEGLDPSPTPDPSSIMRGLTETFQGVALSGNDSRAHPDDRKASNSGFLIKKFSGEPMVGDNSSWVNWIELRLAEMYLTKAEAEFELGNFDIAANALNVTRERAGISAVDENTITLEHVRTERGSELAFETHRYWDLRRWRIAEEVLDASRFQGLQIILHHETSQFYFIPMDAEQYTRSFSPRHYYNPITENRISNNTDLVENPGY